jgi:hypothetical protein
MSPATKKRPPSRPKRTQQDRDIWNAIRSAQCLYLHHAKADQHWPEESCPIELRLKATTDLGAMLTAASEGRVAAERTVKEQQARIDKGMDYEHHTSCGHTWTMRHTACPDCFAAAKAEAARLRELLAPFAALLHDHHRERADASEVFGVTIGDLRRARAALKGQP